jgi:EAL domain-containing protein (putative c-di-GMP-specific phosphodiesterase class I)
VPTRRLLLEITETEMLARSNDVRKELDTLRRAGVRVALDDFGTGYTTLQYLRQLPIDVLKIDRSFVTGLARRDDLQALVKTVLDLANSYHLGVVAEGIEEASDIATLLQLGCDMGQGFGLGVPVPYEAMADLVDRIHQAAVA